jgi:branched-chain amino acid transport system ATP-binding protein
MLKVSGLKAAYEGKEALHGVDIRVPAAGCVCLIGANGAGKTTLMRSLAGTLLPSAGTISFEEKTITGLSASDRVALGIALVPEGRRVFSPLTVLENLQLGAFRRLWPRRQRDVSDSLEFVFQLFPRLKEREKQLAGNLSGGEQQMLAIGRALMSRPRLLLLDEPSMGLAPLVVQDIFRTLATLRDEGLSIFLAEQNAYVALRLAAYGYVISDGRILKEGEVEALHNDPMIAEAYLGI